MCLYYDLNNKSDVQIFRICGQTTRLPEWQTLQIFLVPKIRVIDSQIFVFTLHDFREISSKKSADWRNWALGPRHKSVSSHVLALSARTLKKAHIVSCQVASA